MLYFVYCYYVALCVALCLMHCRTRSFPKFPSEDTDIFNYTCVLSRIREGQEILSLSRRSIRTTSAQEQILKLRLRDLADARLRQ